MITQQLLFALCGVGLFCIGLRAVILQLQLIPRLLALNVCGAGVFLIFVAIAFRDDGTAADPVPHALVLTGIVVAVSAMAMMLALGQRLQALDDE